MHNVLIIFYIAFSIGNLFILPELLHACRERYGVRQSGLFEGFQVYGRQQPLQGLLPVM